MADNCGLAVVPFRHDLIFTESWWVARREDPLLERLVRGEIEREVQIRQKQVITGVLRHRPRSAGKKGLFFFKEGLVG